MSSLTLTSASTRTCSRELDKLAAAPKRFIPTSFIPHCPVCGKPLAMNLRADGTFVEDEGWHAASKHAIP